MDGTMAATPAHKRSASTVIFSFSAMLALVVILSKIYLLPFPVTNPSEFVRWVLRLTIVVAPDVCFIAAVTVICLAACRVLQKFPRAWPVWQFAFFLLYTLLGLYAIASIPMYCTTMVPFTIQLLTFVGGPEVMTDSVAPFLPGWFYGALLATPIMMGFAPRILQPLPWFRAGTPWKGWVAAATVVLVVGYGTICHAYVQSRWTDRNRWERRISQSPHYVLIRSCVEELLKDQPFSYTYNFSEIDTSDFEHADLSLVEKKTPRPLPGMDGIVESTRPPKNVLLVVMESTGTEYLSPYGSKYDTMPNLRRLAAEQGIIFDSVYTQAASSCKSLVALSASTYPRPDWLLIVRDFPGFCVPTVGQHLQRQGYRTTFAHSGYWSWKGRDQYLRPRGTDRMIDASTIEGKLVNSWGVYDDTMFESVFSWIDERPNQPFFAFAYTIETHHPYVAPDPLHDFGVHDEELNRYLNSLRAADAKIARLVEELNRRGLAESTILAVTADHGESFGQHNQRVHGFGVYEPTVHVPLIMINPSFRDAPRHVSTVGEHIDINPTLLDLMGVPANENWQGKSLVRAEPDAKAFFMSVGNEVVIGVRHGKYKYHYYVDVDREELFDLEQDPKELNSLHESFPEICQDLKRRLGGWVTYQRAHLAKFGAD